MNVILDDLLTLLTVSVTRMDGELQRLSGGSGDHGVALQINDDLAGGTMVCATSQVIMWKQARRHHRSRSYWNQSADKGEQDSIVNNAVPCVQRDHVDSFSYIILRPCIYPVKAFTSPSCSRDTDQIWHPGGYKSADHLPSSPRRSTNCPRRSSSSCRCRAEGRLN